MNGHNSKGNRRASNVTNSDEKPTTVGNGSQSTAAKTVKKQKTAADKENVPVAADARDVPGTSGIRRAADKVGKPVSDTKKNSEKDDLPGKSAGETKKKIDDFRKNLRKKITNEEFESNNYPQEQNLTVERKTFSIASTDVDEASTKVPRDAQYSQNWETTCVICGKGKNDDEELTQCEGNMNGGTVGIPCRSRFHISCAKRYNANGYQFHYAVFPECQNKMLCPLHCCAWCTANGRQQSAYIDRLIDCVKCMRAYHYDRCFPSGSVELAVNLNLGNGEVDGGKMMMCPAHPIIPPQQTGRKVNIGACHLCGEKKRKEEKRKLEEEEEKKKKEKKKKEEDHSDTEVENTTGSVKAEIKEKSERKKVKKNKKEKESKKKEPEIDEKKEDEEEAKSEEKEKIEEKTVPAEPLLQCKDCVRSFHAGCVEVQTVDGRPFDLSRCDFCQCNGVLRDNVPVLVKWENEFWLAETRSWEEYPEKKKIEIGYIVVQWILEPTAVFSIVPITDVALLVPEYLPFADTEKDRADWAKSLKDNGTFDRYPPVYKKVWREVTAVRRFNGTAMNTEVQYLEGLCACEGPERCTTATCAYWSQKVECPPICSQDGRVCHNRQVSNQDQKKPEKIERRKAGKKGFGVFALVDLKAGEFIGQYTGELVDKYERERRREILTFVKDSQANHYMMELKGGYTIDAARMGNVTRYINHSCEPNCISDTVLIFHGPAPEDNLHYVERVSLRTLRNIKAGEEITFDYRMDKGRVDDNQCYCGASKCSGRLGADKKSPKASAKGLTPSTSATSPASTSVLPLPKTTPKLPKSQQNKKSSSSLRSTKPKPVSVSKSLTEKTAGQSSSLVNGKVASGTTKPAVASDEGFVPLFHQPLVVTGKRARTLPKKLEDCLDLEPMIKRFAVYADSDEEDEEKPKRSRGDKDDEYNPDE